jgi:hypothetical protein
MQDYKKVLVVGWRGSVGEKVLPGIQAGSLSARLILKKFTSLNNLRNVYWVNNSSPD